jgi:hypothetical protein
MTRRAQDRSSISSANLRSILHKSSTIHLAGGARETSATVIADHTITGAEIRRYDPKTARGSINGAITLNATPELVRDSTGVLLPLINPLGFR